jgi:hypothetical protein
MFPHPVRSSSRLHRRAALGGIGAATVLGLSSHLGHVNAQDSMPGGLASHPIVGAWLVVTPAPPSPAIFTADGFIINGTPANYVDPDHGVVFQGVALGAWEPLGERQVHLSFTQTLTDADGAFLGTFTVDGHPMVSEDGQTFTDNTPDARLVFRDASNTVVSDVVVAAGVTATRITPGSVVFPAPATASATPTS